MKKKGIIDTLVKVGIAAAAVGGTIYLLKDKIEEDPKYKEAVDKVKDTIKSYMPSKEEPVDEDDFFDEDFDRVIHTSSSERGYVNIKLPGEEEFEEEDNTIADAAEEIIEDFTDAAKEVMEDLADAAEDAVEDIADAVETAVEETTEA